MRLINYIFLCVSAAFLMACEKPDTVIEEKDPKYSGRMTVRYEGEDFVQNDIKVQVGFSSDSTSVDIKLLKVKFVPAMPVRIDVTVMEVPVTRSDDGDSQFYGDGIVPWAMGGPYDTYRVDGLQGRISDGELEFSMTFYNTKKQEGYPTSYDGTR